jgi:hypothetical protein
VTDEFDPDKWWTWPIPEHAILDRHPDGRPRHLDPFGEGWIDGFEAGRNSMAEEILASPEGQQMTRSIVRDL